MTQEISSSKAKPYTIEHKSSEATSRKQLSRGKILLPARRVAGARRRAPVSVNQDAATMRKPSPSRSRGSPVILRILAFLSGAPSLNSAFKEENERRPKSETEVETNNLPPYMKSSVEAKAKPVIVANASVNPLVQAFIFFLQMTARGLQAPSQATPEPLAGAGQDIVKNQGYSYSKSEIAHRWGQYVKMGGNHYSNNILQAPSQITISWLKETDKKFVQSILQMSNAGIPREHNKDFIQGGMVLINLDEGFPMFMRYVIDYFKNRSDNVFWSGYDNRLKYYSKDNFDRYLENHGIKSLTVLKEYLDKTVSHQTASPLYDPLQGIVLRRWEPGSHPERYTDKDHTDETYASCFYTVPNADGAVSSTNIRVNPNDYVVNKTIYNCGYRTRYFDTVTAEESPTLRPGANQLAVISGDGVSEGGIIHASAQSNTTRDFLMYAIVSAPTDKELLDQVSNWRQINKNNTQ